MLNCRYITFVMYLDPSGEIAWPIIAIGVIVAVYVIGLIVHSIGSDPASDTLYDTPDEAAIAWKNEYQSQSQDKEYSAILYLKEVDGVTKYYYGRTYEGYSNNCIPGLFYGYTTGLIENIFSSRQTVGFIHSHPQPPVGYYNDFFSKPDFWVINLPGIDYMYLVPYTNSGYSTQPSDTRFVILW